MHAVVVGRADVAVESDLERRLAGGADRAGHEGARGPDQGEEWVRPGWASSEDARPSATSHETGVAAPSARPWAPGPRKRGQ